MTVHEKAIHFHLVSWLFTRQRILIPRMRPHHKLSPFHPNHGRMVLCKACNNVLLLLILLSRLTTQDHDQPQNTPPTSLHQCVDSKERNGSFFQVIPSCHLGASTCFK